MGTYQGSPASEDFEGGDGADSFLLNDGGDDTVRGGAGNDGVFFGATLTSSDSVDGGDGVDTVSLQGDYTAGLALGDIRNVETLLFLSGSDTRFGASGTERFGYKIAAGALNVGAGQTLSVIATGLLGNETLDFDATNIDGNLRLYAGRGADTFVGGAGNDGFFFGDDGNFSGADRIDGGAGTDTVALRGNYHSERVVTFQNGSLTDVEVLALLSGRTNEYTGAIVPDGFIYQVTMAEGNVAAGKRMDINAAGLGIEERLIFDGHLENDGSFRILSGGGNDSLNGSQGDDIIYGGLGSDGMSGMGGHDRFIYRSAAESTQAQKDTIGDLSVGDVIDLSAIDANSLTDAKDAFTLIGADPFSGTAGELRLFYTFSNFWSAMADVDGDGVADLVIEVRVEEGHSLTMVDSLVMDVLTAPPPHASATPVLIELEPNSMPYPEAIDRSLLAIAPNADLADASLPSLTIHGEIGDTRDDDTFTITLVAGEKLILDVDHSRGGLDAVIVVQDGYRKPITENDDLVDPDPGSDQSAAVDGHNTDSFISFRAPTSGEYTFTVKSFESGSSGAYDLHVSIAPVATPAEIQAEDIQSLISGERWPGTALTYSFPTSAIDYSDYASYGAGFTEPDSFLPFSPQQQLAARATLGSLSALTDLTFVELAGDPGSATLRYAMSSDPDTAYAYYPGQESYSGDSWFNKVDYNAPSPGSYDYTAILHETGHALGLKHGHEFPGLSPASDSLEYSVMTYRPFTGADLDGYTNETFGFPQTYMMYDIAALQQMYGADFETQAGDTTYSWSSTTGQMSINGAGQAMPGANRVFMTIWDGGGNDTFDLSNYGNGVNIDLRPGEWTSTSPVQIAALGEGHYARGNVANALLYNGDPRSLIENGIGGEGSDVLTANQAANHLTGNGGADTFRWKNAADSRPGQADTIEDFQSGVDHIDLSSIDADPRSPYDDQFRWIGSTAFSGAAGEVRGEVIEGNLHIFADMNADGVADFEIVLAHQTQIAPSDFIFW